MAWLMLLGAGLLEVAWALGLKLSDGFTRPLPTLITLALAGLSFFLLSLSLREIPIGTAYAVWTGIGAVGVAVAGMVLFDEPREMARLLFMSLIVAGIVGLKLTSAG